MSAANLQGAQHAATALLKVSYTMVLTDLAVLRAEVSSKGYSDFAGAARAVEDLCVIDSLIVFLRGRSLELGS